MNKLIDATRCKQIESSGKPSTNTNRYLHELNAYGGIYNLPSGVLKGGRSSHRSTHAAKRTTTQPKVVARKRRTSSDHFKEPAEILCIQFEDCPEFKDHSHHTHEGKKDSLAKPRAKLGEVVRSWMVEDPCGLAKDGSIDNGTQEVQNQFQRVSQIHARHRPKKMKVAQ
eukprot:CAMPEP_0169108814 /NCGR_PEP_ID=MMETSP1015-20121227/25628_1 /TAXON_ID=342587 /ORGANISM="Karlodinium micrum, Strain CCMP2283" /LENGTH=168 /DNA_ID=CAMNT_0009170461 /DNA_START=326 /DNA_END=832 /DNA_ORIENTATION=+